MGEPRLVNMSEATFGEGATDLFDDPAHEFEGMGVLGFGDGAFGSAAIAIDGILDKIADRIGGSYWLIPSSIHELLVLADNDSFDAPTLNRMIRDANEVVCEPGDVLSWNARYYDKDTKTLSVM